MSWKVISPFQRKKIHTYNILIFGAIQKIHSPYLKSVVWWSSFLHVYFICYVLQNLDFILFLKSTQPLLFFLKLDPENTTLVIFSLHFVEHSTFTLLSLVTYFVTNAAKEWLHHRADQRSETSYPLLVRVSNIKPSVNTEKVSCWEVLQGHPGCSQGPDLQTVNKVRGWGGWTTAVTSTDRTTHLLLVRIFDLKQYYLLLVFWPSASKKDWLDILKRLFKRRNAAHGAGGLPTVEGESG